MGVDATGDGHDGPDLEITLTEFLRDWRGPEVRLVDVREPDEWEAGRMPGGVLIPLGELEARSGELNPAAPTVIVCRSGRRSLIAAEYLKAIGFDRPVSLAGGILAWAEAGHPVER